MKDLEQKHPELREISVEDFQRLLRYRRSLFKAASTCTEERTQFYWGFWSDNHRFEQGCIKLCTRDITGRDCHQQPWFVDFMCDLGHELVTNPWNEEGAKAKLFAPLDSKCPCQQCKRITPKTTQEVDRLMRFLSDRIREEQSQVSHNRVLALFLKRCDPRIHF